MSEDESEYRQSKIRRITRPARVALLIGTVGALAWLSWPRRWQYDVPTSAIQEMVPGGRAYVVGVPPYPSRWFHLPSDSSLAPTASQLILLENGTPIGKPHSVHDDIRQHGSGAFSHWGDTLYFSSSDTTDPRTNGRHYSVQSPLLLRMRLQLARVLVFIVVLGGLVKLGSHRLRSVRGAMQPLRRIAFVLLSGARTLNAKAATVWLAGGTLSIYYLYLFAFAFPVFPYPSPDSYSYISWDLPHRTFGYPLFLTLYDLLPGTWHYLPAAQATLIVGSLTVLAAGVASVTRSSLLAVVMLLVVTSLDCVMTYAQPVLTEAIFASAIYAAAGCALLAIHRPQIRFLVSAGCLLACAVAVRPIAMTLPIAFLTLPRMVPRRTLAAAVALVAPTAVCLIAMAGYNKLMYGPASVSSIGGYAMLGHVGWALEPDPQGHHPALQARLAEAVRPVLAKRPTRFATLQAYATYTTNEYNELLWQTIVPAAADWMRDESAVVKREQLGALLMTVAKDTIRRHPLEYAYHVFAHYWALWHGMIWHDSLIDSFRRLYYPTIEAYRAFPEVWSTRIDMAGMQGGDPDTLFGSTTGLESAPLELAMARGGIARSSIESSLIVLTPLLFWASLPLLGLWAAAFLFPTRFTGSSAVACVHSAAVLSAVTNDYFLSHALAQVFLSRYAGVLAPIACAMAFVLLPAAVGTTMRLRAFGSWVLGAVDRARSLVSVMTPAHACMCVVGCVCPPALVCVVLLSCALFVARRERAWVAMTDYQRGVAETIVTTQLKRLDENALPAVVILGDSSGLMGVSPDIVEDAVGQPVAGFCTMAYAGPQSVACMLTRLSRSEKPPRLVVLSMHPAGFARDPSWQSWTDFVARWPAAVPEPPSRLLDPRFVSLAIRRELLYTPLPGAFGLYYGGVTQLANDLVRTQGSAIDPGVFPCTPIDSAVVSTRTPVPPAAATAGQSPYEPTSLYFDSLPPLRDAIHEFGSDRVILVWSPVGFWTESDMAVVSETVRRTNHILGLEPHAIVDDFLFTMPQQAFSSNTHLNAAGKLLYSGLIAQRLIAPLEGREP